MGTSKTGSVFILRSALVIFLPILSKVNSVESTRFARSESRIADGVNVTPVNKYPMIVSIMKTINDECIGTILNKYYVLTTGRCGDEIKYSLPNSYALAGIYNLEDPDLRYVQNISVKSVTTHKRVSDERKGYASNDIAVVRLRSALVWNNHVAPTNLPNPGWNVLPNQEIKVTIPGWGVGRNQTYPLPSSRPLQEVELPMVTTETCQRVFSSTQLTYDIVCYKAVEGAGACNGDWGSPLFVYNEEDDKHTQI